MAKPIGRKRKKSGVIVRPWEARSVGHSAKNNDNRPRGEPRSQPATTAPATPPRSTRSGGQRSTAVLSPVQKQAVKKRKVAHFQKADGVKNHSKMMEDKARRLLIYARFVGLWSDEDPATAPPEAEWGKRITGSIAVVCKELDLNSSNYNVVCRRVFMDVVACKEDGRLYDGTDARAGNGGLNKTIKTGSRAEHLVCDLYEQGFSITDTTDALNEFWETAFPHEPHFGRSAVGGALKRRKDILTSHIGKRKTGSFNPCSNWARARFGWVTQLLIRFGKTPPGFNLAWLKQRGLVEDSAEAIPPMFDKDELPALDIKRVGFWDETHRKCKPGRANRRGTQTRFKRNQHGKLDAIRGTYADQLFYLQAKYEQESRLAAGVCITEEDGRTCVSGTPCG
jgi:hypothetical protein